MQTQTVSISTLLIVGCASQLDIICTGVQRQAGKRHREILPIWLRSREKLLISQKLNNEPGVRAATKSICIIAASPCGLQYLLNGPQLLQLSKTVKRVSRAIEGRPSTQQFGQSRGEFCLPVLESCILPMPTQALSTTETGSFTLVKLHP